MQRTDSTTKLEQPFEAGFANHPLGATVKYWLGKYKETLLSGVTTQGLLVNKPTGQHTVGKYTTKVEKEHPGFLHQCYRAATKQCGTDASWRELADGMNLHSSQVEGKETLFIKRVNVL